MNVRNRGCIRRLSFKTLLAARKRNIIAIIAIALTSLLFTSLFTIAMSINATNQNYQFRSVGTYSHGSFKDVNEEQIAALSAHPKVKASGTRTVIGLCTSGAFEKNYGEVSYMSDNTAKWSYAQPTSGRMPRSGNEIAMDTTALALLGVTPELGAQVTFTYTIADKEQLGSDVTDTFTLVGWWDYDRLMDVHYLNVSEEYVRRIEAEAMADGMEQFRTDLSVMLSSSVGIEEALTRIAEDCGYTAGDEAGCIRLGVNWGYTMTQLSDTMGAGGLLAIAAIAVLVAFTGHLVIYNIFQISVAGDIRFYGLLKTIGVTPRQLRRIIRQQALMLSAAGIPLGLLLGYGVGAAAVPITLASSTFSAVYTSISISPWIFLGSAAFSLVTVLLSCSRPGRIAGNVSPVEALRYTETQHISRKPRVTRRVTPFSMACANLGRGAKKTALVIISLALAVVLLDLLSALLGGFDMDKYLSHSICADFIVSTPDYFNYRGILLTKEDISPVMANTEQSRGGFTYTSALIYTYLPEEVWMDEAAHYMRGQNAEDMLAAAERERDKISAVSQIEALDPALMDKVRVIDGDISPLLDLDSRSIAIDVSLDDSGNLPDPDIYPAVGDRVKVTFDTNGRQWDAEYTVCALVEIPYTMTSRFYTMGYRVLMGVEALTREAGEEWVFPMAYVFDTPDDEAEAEAESYLSELSSSAGSSVMYESKATKREHFHEFQMTFAVLGGLLCAIIGIVGILNFFNAMMTSVLSRQREFAVLHAVGQSAKQLKAMLIWEGLLYTVGAGSISLLLSAVINPLAGRIFENAYWFYSYRFTMTPVLLAIPAFALLGCVIPAIMYKQSTKRSIVECLREAEN